MEDNKTLQEILETVNSTFETVNFIKDNAVTKDEFNEFKEEVNGRFDNLESELRSIRIELIDINRCLDQLEKRTKEDSDAHASDILELRQRVQMLERQVGQLQPAR
ncbi:MAG: hypothetical protein A2921_00245 [Candidatus Magasanikbacteria bacterium RIFCSPLOWO2_01_FULL_43_20b]|nr:MAG: hypothetical protein A3C74_02405 [Candidatus Magasanikbacteria bacterium RIFCSPHIGHO2_02_FULL_44_13]OGH72688.1 MAG: hypothetical protein A3I93_03195 [Candidatus Magasanikbacteria bacterium RIFCSPLOWO2_02_FULL_43_22]OGH73168.1 MAG: hypothetical protein A2921_00245 [Candidatus Magasanikbacteria bacterium RIFCSPLOWO2_01_FULL_43_20b]